MTYFSDGEGPNGDMSHFVTAQILHSDWPKLLLLVQFCRPEARIVLKDKEPGQFRIFNIYQLPKTVKVQRVSTILINI